jgi:uncharacterized protein (DUF488 family)
MRVWTIGHSNIALETFLERLRAHEIALIADVRRFPASRRHPHFSEAALAAALEDCHIGYLHLPELGGRRSPRPDSRNTAWRNDAFRGYADYMEAPAFHAGVDRLLVVAAGRRTAVMCAEALWWQCHRGLIADYLKADGHEVLHIAANRVDEHPYTSAARIVDGGLTYQDTGLFR